MYLFSQVMYKRMKARVKNVIERGKVTQEYITGEEEIQAFNKWMEEFTHQDHPTVIQVNVIDIAKHI